MSNVLQECLYKKHNRRFESIQELAISFSANYCGNTIIRDSIFGIVSNFARIKELNLELLRYPFRDDELWAFTFVKKGTVFLCVNSELAMCKQIFATAHELYHIYCYATNSDDTFITHGSLLDSKTADETAVTMEDSEANAFAGMLLMSDSSLSEQIRLYGISKEKMTVDDILVLMELFALPYKAVVLRLFESKEITEDKALELLAHDTSYVMKRIELTGKAQQWQKNSTGLLYFGSLMDNLSFNSENELITTMREDSDEQYVNELRSVLLGEG